MMGKDYMFDQHKHKLGSLCAKTHDWNKTGKSLRYISNGKCVQCQQERSAIHYQQNRELIILRSAQWQRQNLTSADRVARTLAYRQKRKDEGTYTRSKYGLPFGFLSKNGINRANAPKVAELLNRGMNVHQIKETLGLHDKYLENVGYSLTVSDLVREEQLRYWRENPEARRVYLAEFRKHQWKLKYMIDQSLRLYHREKSKRRKALNRGQKAVAIPSSALQRRFNEFGNCCAYCGNPGFMEIEHIIPISKGGLHDISNIVPSCTSCNSSKQVKDMECWYRTQPFFSQARLDRILRIAAASADTQLSLAVG